VGEAEVGSGCVWPTLSPHVLLILCQLVCVCGERDTGRREDATGEADVLCWESLPVGDAGCVWRVACVRRGVPFESVGVACVASGVCGVLVWACLCPRGAPSSPLRTPMQGLGLAENALLMLHHVNKP
jgi:hypothetical protein